jgi:release factor glutamine methyltransferase
VIPPTADLFEQAVRRLQLAGCVAAEEEAGEMAAVEGGDFMALVERRCTGEPLAWVTGSTMFCGIPIAIGPGVYVPRWQSEALAERAAALLPATGRAIDIGTGSGAIARVMTERRPDASVLGTERDSAAAECARHNGVDVVQGDLFEGMPRSWEARVNVIVGVMPYVPTDQIAFLPRDVQDFEPIGALDGGSDGLTVIRRVVAESRRWLHDEGHLLLEIGGDQADPLVPMLRSAGFHSVETLVDEDGDLRGVEASAGRRPDRP